MRRVAVDPEAASGNSADIQPQAQLKNLPRLRLLVELEPAYRVFLRNLSDTLRSIPPRAHEFRSLSFWREVLFCSGLPWRRFGQSLLGHAVVLALVLIVSHSRTQDQPLRRSPFENTHLTYYKPDGSYPALRGNPAPVQRASRKQIDSARRGSIRVAPERAAQAAIKAPDIKLKGPARPNMAASNAVLPAMPLASTGSSRFSGPSSPTAIVAPPPEVSQGTSRRARFAAGLRRRPRTPGRNRILKACGDRARCGRGWPATSFAGLDKQSWGSRGHQYRSGCSGRGRARAAIAGGRAAHNFRLTPVGAGRPGGIGRAASA